MVYVRSLEGLPPEDIESRRLTVLANLGILDTAPEHEFDTIVQCAQRMLDCPIALISLIDQSRQWFKARCGLEAAETHREMAFCAHVVTADEQMIVPDATQDVRFAANPLVTGEPHIRFYAGVPIRARISLLDSRRVPMGTLCIIDYKVRHLEPEQIAMLRELAHLVEMLFEARMALLNAAVVAEERQSAIERLNHADRQFRQAERMANIGSWRLNLATNTTKRSDQIYAIHGVAVGNDELLDMTLDFYPPHARDFVTDTIRESLATGKPFDFETDFITALGQNRRVRSMGEVEMQDGIAVALIGVFQDVTERHAMEQALRRIAFSDDLTRIASRAHFNQVIDEKIAGAAPMALLIIDLDHFKSVNDRCGHHGGDQLLRLFALRLQAPYLADSFAARLGGDEFVLLITSPHILSDLEGVLQRLLLDLQHVVAEAGFTIKTSATIGICLFDADIRDRSDFLKRADSALYRAKETLRGSAAIFGREGLILPRAGSDLALTRH
jgi:diguanylate cyclase (GGDEF)-like protein